MTIDQQNLPFAMELSLRRVHAAARCIAVLSRQKTADSEIRAALGLVCETLDDAVEDAREALDAARA